jgi:hypothetical protein
MRKIPRIVLYCLGGLIVLVPLYHLIENTRGNLAWKAWVRSREAAGDRLDLKSFAPPPVADADNFAASPKIAASIAGSHGLVNLPTPWPTPADGGWREGVRFELAAFEPAFPKGIEPGLAEFHEVLEELAQAARRPGCRIPTDYAAAEPAIPAFLGFRAAARILQLRALTALRAGHRDAAFQDVQTLLLLVRQLEQEPMLLSHLLRVALAGIALQPLWEGFEGHAWSAPQLQVMEAELAHADFLASTARSWKMEQAYMSLPYHKVAALPPWSTMAFPMTNQPAPLLPPLGIVTFARRLAMPRGWLLQNAVRSAVANFSVMTDPLDPLRHRIDPRRQDAALAAQTRPGRSPYTFLATYIGPALSAQNIRSARIQVAYDQARIACGLERLRLATGAYPERLEALGNTLPNDVIDGQPLRYRRTAEGGYVLYSLGWNGSDEQGQPGRGKEPLLEGDWTWIIHR